MGIPIGTRVLVCLRVTEYGDGHGTTTDVYWRFSVRRRARFDSLRNGLSSASGRTRLTDGTLISAAISTGLDLIHQPTEEFIYVLAYTY